MLVLLKHGTQNMLSRVFADHCVIRVSLHMPRMLLNVLIAGGVDGTRGTTTVEGTGAQFASRITRNYGN